LLSLGPDSKIVPVSQETRIPRLYKVTPPGTVVGASLEQDDREGTDHPANRKLASGAMTATTKETRNKAFGGMRPPEAFSLNKTPPSNPLRIEN
jgi:hypothetical protein